MPDPTSIEVQPRPAASTAFKIRHLRWYVCGLLFLASMINYVDRQAIAVLKPHLETLMNWSESDYGWIVFAFQLAYAIMMLISGKMIDWLGVRAGYAASITWWSLAEIGHSLARGARSFGAVRFLLGAGEAGNFPASIKAVAEWFPVSERALATGIFNSGTNVGAVAAAPVVVWLTLRWGWQGAFVFTGALGFIWLVVWLAIYRSPERHPWATGEELQHIQSRAPGAEQNEEGRISWWQILGYREAWAFIGGKFMTDPIWWFYVLWLPSYLKQARGFSLIQIGYFAWIPFLAALPGSVAGGWLSSFWIKRQWTVNRARKLAMVVCAFSMPAGIAAVYAPNAWLALALISIATSAHQGWSANLFTLTSDFFPKKDVGTVVGLGGAGGAVGGMILAVTAGYLLEWFHTYVPLFLIAGVMHPLAIGLIHWLVPRIEPIAAGRT